MAATGEFVLDPTTGQPQYRIMQDDSGLIHVQVRRRPADTVMRGENIQRPPLHNIREARLQPQVDTHNVYSSAGVDSSIWVKENDASDASKARTCGPKSSPQRYGEGTHSPPSLPSTSSLQHNPFNAQNINYSSLPPQSDPRGFGQGTLGLNNTVLETTTSVEGNGAGAIYHYEPRYHGSGNFPQATLYQNQHCAPLGTGHNHYNSFENYAQATDSQYYQSPANGASNAPLSSSVSSQYAVGTRSEVYRKTTPDMPDMPMIRVEVRNPAAVAPHPANTYQHFPPAVTTQDARYANKLNDDAMNSQMTSAVPKPNHYMQTPEEQNQCAFSPPEPNPNVWTIEELYARSKETNDFVAYDPAVDNERKSVAPKTPSHLEISDLIPPAIACMSVHELLKALNENSDVHPSLALHSVYTMAETMLMFGWTKARVRKQMAAWAAQLGQVTGQQVPLAPASLTKQRLTCNLNGCRQTFSSKGALVKHQRYSSAHSNCATFFCSNCDAKFLRGDSLKRHEEKGPCVRSG